MTEDDTFNALRKTPILDMMKKVVAVNLSSKHPVSDYKWGQLFKINGWTRQEYQEEHPKHIEEYLRIKND